MNPAGLDEEENMDASSSAEEKKVEAGSQIERSNLGATENASSDDLTPLDTSKSKIKRTTQNTESGKVTKRSRAEKLMKCPKCEGKFAPPSVSFCKETNDQYEFNIGPQQDSGDNLTGKLDWTDKAAVKENTKQCPECKNSFLMRQRVVSSTNKMGGFNIEFSIDITKDDKLTGGTQNRNSDNGGREQDNGENRSSEKSTGGTQNKNYDYEGMEQDDMEDHSSERSTGRNTDKPLWSRLKDKVSNLTESMKSSSRKPEQSNQTTADSEGLPFVSRWPAVFQPPTPVMKVHYTPTTDTFGADAAIMKQLKNNLKLSAQLEKTTRDNCSIIIVFCPVSRSFESEVKLAMKKEEVSSSGKPFILVLMHHTRDWDYSTAGCDASEVLKNVFYVHVFYHETTKGLIQCNQNDRAIKRIEEKLQTYKQYCR